MAADISGEWWKDFMRLKACHCCGLVQQIPDLTAGQQARCSRCSSIVDRPGRDGRQSAARCLAASTGALILYFPAILLPILRIEKLGHHSEAGLLSGTLDLLHHGNWFVGTVVLLFSIILPLVKLTALFELSWVSLVGRKHKAWTYRLVETAGRWSMMDVLLLALLVTVVKLGDLVEFSFGPAVIAFSLCVFMSLIASAVFDPHAIWEESDVK